MAERIVSESGSPLGPRLTVAAIFLLASPCLFLAYLPMTDLPQHEAVMSILRNLGDPAFGFDAWYEAAPERSLYYFTYAIAIGLSQLIPLEIAVRVVVFLSAIAYPLGVLAVLRATGRPAALALLALPLMYNRPFFWGFVNFNLGLGMALFAISLLERRARGLRSELALALLCATIVITHVYAIAIVLGYLCLRLLVADRRELLRRLPALAPLAIGALVWFERGRGVAGRGEAYFSPLLTRLARFEDSVIGGYPDRGDELLLIAMLASTTLLAAGSFPWSRARWRVLGRCERIFALYFVLNVLLYLALPTHLKSGHFINFRHALLAVAFLPLLTRLPNRRPTRLVAGVVLTGLTGLTFAIHGSHLLRFDREARGFDEVIAQLPDAPRVYFLSWDQEGAVTETHAYHHFHAYIQARRGGLISFSFPELFWNIPVRVRENAGIPKPVEESEWHPELFDYDAVGHFYDYVLVRTPLSRRGRGVTAFAKFPYESIHASPPWELYRHRTKGLGE